MHASDEDRKGFGKDRKGLVKGSSQRSRGRPALPKASKCGTTTGYAQGCRCPGCKAAVAAYQREYQARPEVVNRRALAALSQTPEGRAALDALAARQAAPAEDARETWVRDTLL